MELQLKIAGFALMALALCHVIFPRYFGWRAELATVSLVTRQIVYVHTLFIALTVFGMGLLCASMPEELLASLLGRRICLGLSLFWFVRMLVQHFGYSSLLWRGKYFETGVHILFSIAWLYLTVLFFCAFRSEAMAGKARPVRPAARPTAPV